MEDGIVVGVLFSSGGIGTAFQGGYEPTGVNGIVTGLGYDSGESGIVTTGTGRHISEIDGEPAAVVSDRWNDGSLPRDAPRDGGTNGSAPGRERVCQTGSNRGTPDH